jgi:hypothetical protein
LTPCCGLEVQNPTQALKSVEGPEIPYIPTPNGKELYRSVAILHGIFIGSPLKIQISKLIFDTLLEVQNPTNDT